MHGVAQYLRRLSGSCRTNRVCAGRSPIRQQAIVSGALESASVRPRGCAAADEREVMG
jgi:hypothetical protein